MYDDQDRLTRQGETTYDYNRSGQLTQKSVGTLSPDVTTYSYDELGNLVSVDLPDGTSIEYLVDGRNRRIGRMENGTLTRAFLYEGQLNPVAELDGNGDIVSRFVYGTKANVPRRRAGGA